MVTVVYTSHALEIENTHTHIHAHTHTHTHTCVAGSRIHGVDAGIVVNVPQKKSNLFYTRH